MFVLFLLVLLGVSALAIDYASWLLTDRSLQNFSDHAALAGASAFDDRTISSANCSGGLGQPKCYDARKQAWASLSNELDLNLSATIISCLATQGGLGGNSPNVGETDSSRANAGGCTGESVVDFKGHTLWVATPPPNDGSYLNYDGRYAQNYGIVWVRVDRPVRSFVGGALGIQPKPRTGWATAGALPADFALETFCRNNIAPESGVCVNSAGVTVDGQGGIRLLRGDVGSNESLTISAATGNGAIIETGNMFLVNRVCSNGTWSCPGNPQDPYGGIVNGEPSLGGAIMKNAFYMAPLPVPQFQSPVDGVDHSANCTASDVATTLCVPWAGQGTLDSPGDWTCSTSLSTPVRCGAPTVTTVGNSSTVECVGQGGGVSGNHYYPVGPSLNSVNANPSQSNANKFQNIDDTSGDPDTLTTPINPSADFLWIDDINVTGAGGPQTTSFVVNLGQSGPRLGGTSTVRYTAFKTDGGVPNNTLNPVTLRVTLQNGSGGTILADPTPRTLTDVPQEFEFTVGAGVIPAAQFNSLKLQFSFTSSGSTAAADERGGAIAWAEIEHPGPQPAVAPMIPPGYYESIVIPDGACAVMDPTGEYSGLKAYQMPGIYQFGGDGNTNDWKIDLGTGAFLIGDGVTLVFDAGWPDSGSHKGVATASDSAIVLNTMRVPGVPPCTPTETEASTVNESAASLGLLTYSSVCGAWGVDTKVSSGVRPGALAWAPCTTTSATSCINRLSDYAPVAGYRGITFYFTPDPGWGTAHASMNPRNRFEMQGTDAGLAFRGVMYAPYDDVKISGGNGFSTVGQVLSWTVKFNGGSAFIDLDYPYEPTPAAPYLLEPTIDH
jgi:hypothetical protein